MHAAGIEPIWQAETTRFVDLDPTTRELFYNFRNEAPNDFIHAEDDQSSVPDGRVQSCDPSGYGVESKFPPSRIPGRAVRWRFPL
jgi:hypothetical protein